jgi:putative thioredoxin
MCDRSCSYDLARKTYIAVLDIMEAPEPRMAYGQIPSENADWFHPEATAGFSLI